MNVRGILARLTEPVSPADLTAVRRELAELHEPRLKPYLWELDSLLRDGLCGEAARRIELILNPKFDSAYECQKQYRAHMRAQHGAVA